MCNCQTCACGRQAGSWPTTVWVRPSKHLGGLRQAVPVPCSSLRAGSGSQRLYVSCGAVCARQRGSRHTDVGCQAATRLCAVELPHGAMKNMVHRRGCESVCVSLCGAPLGCLCPCVFLIGTACASTRPCMMHVPCVALNGTPCASTHPPMYDERTLDVLLCDPSPLQLKCVIACR
jgi:hypothetical protein